MDNENQTQNDEQPCIDENQFKYVRRVSQYVSNYDYMFRISIIGDANVGKTSLLTRYCDSVFKENYNNTIGVDFRLITLQFKDNVFTKLHIWDTAGQERFKSISVNYFRSVHGFMFVYDISDKNSFMNLQSWIELAFANNKNSVVNFLVGNKNDLIEKRQVSENEGKELASIRKFNFLETSAKNNDNVDKIFQYFCYKLISHYSKHKNDYEIISKKQNEKLKMEDINKNLEIPQRKKKKCAC
jgi:Ras-related protein Rab-1A